MKLVLISPYDKALLGNKLFARPSLFTSLKEKLNEVGYELNTIDKRSIKEADKIIFHDNPRKDSYGHKEYLDAIAQKKYLILLITEAPIIIPEIWEPSLHSNFAKVISWNDSLVDHKKYFRISYSGGYSCSNRKRDFLPFHERKLCVMVSGCKDLDHNLALYSERRRAIAEFETLCPCEFDLWGRGWNADDKIKIESYRGSVEDKIELMSKYKFSICYENMRGSDEYTGYITEKIHDSFFAHCVPVYLGAQNITDYIPANTFIDFDSFGDYKELYAYLSNMTAQEFYSYIDNISDFMDSTFYYDTFSPQAFINTLYNHLVADLPKMGTK
jgi:hypothetical protein